MCNRLLPPSLVPFWLILLFPNLVVMNLLADLSVGKTWRWLGAMTFCHKWLAICLAPQLFPWQQAWNKASSWRNREFCGISTTNNSCSWGICCFYVVGFKSNSFFYVHPENCGRFEGFWVDVRVFFQKGLVFKPSSMLNFWDINCWTFLIWFCYLRWSFLIPCIILLHSGDGSGVETGMVPWFFPRQIATPKLAFGAKGHWRFASFTVNGSHVYWNLSGCWKELISFFNFVITARVSWFFSSLLWLMYDD